MKTLKNFLRTQEPCKSGFVFAKDLTLEQFLKTCQRADWILWLFNRTNPDSLKEITLAKAHCANTLRHLMKDERSIKAVDIAIAFGEGAIGFDEFQEAYDIAHAALCDSGDDAAYVAYVAATLHAYEYFDFNLKNTADICRRYLPIEIWNTIDI